MTVKLTNPGSHDEAERFYHSVAGNTWDKHVGRGTVNNKSEEWSDSD